MTYEQITTRYMRGWISLAEYRAELVKLYDREDAKDAQNETHHEAAAQPYSQGAAAEGIPGYPGEEA